MSVLDDMTKGISEAKALKSTKLTPVGAENEPTKPSLAGRHEAPFPYDDSDMTQGAIRDGLKVLALLQTHVDFIGKGLIELAKLYGIDPDQSPINMPARQVDRTIRPIQIDPLGPDGANAAPVQESEDFSERYKAQQAAAQADVFAAPTNIMPSPDRSGWTCPVHGDVALVELESKRTKRKYRSCKATNCLEFEK